MKKSIIFIIILSSSIRVFSQAEDSTSRIGLAEISRVNQGNSYITFPVDIGNIEPLWFEANLIPSFYIRESKNSRLMGVLTPQIILRMYQEKSYPVRTPSYTPQVTVYYSIKEELNGKKFTLFGRYAHHSNGQDGDFFLEDGEINHISGDFSTNYFETGFITTFFREGLHAHQFFKSSIEVHPDTWSSKNLKNIYSKYRWHNDISIYKLSTRNDSKKKKAGLSVKGELTWMFGELSSTDWYSPDRLNLSLNFSYFPKFLEDIGFFAQYYQGFDYYNIYFSHHLHMMRFGLKTEQLRF